jgi:double-stranded uracil-DNA glycosylase
LAKINAVQVVEFNSIRAKVSPCRIKVNINVDGTFSRQIQVVVSLLLERGYQDNGVQKNDVLPDVLGVGLDLVLCGSAVGTRSAQRRAYYAGPGNAFWPTLYRIGLTDRQLCPEEYSLLADYGIGLTDMAKRRFGGDSQLRRGDYDPEDFRTKMQRYAPRAFGFNGKAAARAFFGHAVQYGRQPGEIAGSVVFVLPSTSGAARRYWSESPWSEMAAWIRDTDPRCGRKRRNPL